MNIIYYKDISIINNNMEINNYKNKLTIRYYNNILKHMIKNNIDHSWVTDYIQQLNQNNLDEKNSEITENKTESIIVLNNNELDTHKKIFSDDNLYKKPWAKLNPIHKILKIKDFINGLKFNLEENRIKLKDELVLLIKSKVLTKKEKVNYDEVNGKIISLTDLEFKNGTYIYIS